MALEKVKIARISQFTKDKDGNPLVSKTGKPYARCLIDLVDGRKVSGFGNKTTSAWSEGMEVEMEIVQNGQYWNFSVPKTEGGTFTDEDRKKLDTIYSYVISHTAAKAQSMSEPVEELPASAIPF